MPQAENYPPEVGDRVKSPDGIERIVTDIRQGLLILRPVHGSYKEFPVRPDQVTPLPDRPPQAE